MVVVIFRSRLAPECASEYGDPADEMLMLAEKMPGFISFSAFAAEDGERVAIQEWESEADVAAWRDHPRHREVQALGRSRFYTSYTLHVCVDPRTATFNREGTH